MKLYTDIFSDAEILSDGFPIKLEFNGVVGKVKSRLINKVDGDVDIGCGNAFGGAGEEEQAGGNPVAKVIDIVDNFALEETSFDQAGFNSYFKDYMKKVLGHLKANKPDRVEAFMAGAKEFFAWAKANFDDLVFYYKDYDMENHVMIGKYEEGDDAPTFYYIMDGLKETKVWVLYMSIYPIPT